MDDEFDEWDPWDVLQISCGGYNSAVDAQAIAVARDIRDGKYMTDIAATSGMTQEHVELWQYIFCSARLCDYGTSPRACFPVDEKAFDEFVRKFEVYYVEKWKEPVPA